MTVRSFADVVGQDRAVGILRRAIQQQRLHHANLLSGPEGTGKRTVARLVAQRLNCDDPRGEDPCGVCRGCRLVASDSHPDVVTVRPDGRNIKVEQIREVISLMRFRPSEGGSRVVMFEDADLMREEGANAMLKTLEEPGADTVFFLLTAQPQRLLTTIRSRCQPLLFGALSQQQVVHVLRGQGVDATDDALWSAARAGDGSVSQSLDLLTADWWLERATTYERFAGLVDGQPDALLWAEELGKQRERVEPSLRLFRILLRDAMLVLTSSDTGRTVDPAGAGVHRLARSLGLDAVLRLLSELELAEQLLLGNVNPRMVLESLFLKVASMGAATMMDPR
jgi:DNA polymerase-3 subunit delta'